MGVSDVHLEHNRPNTMLVDGSKKLGYPISKIPVRPLFPLVAEPALRRSRR